MQRIQGHLCWIFRWCLFGGLAIFAFVEVHAQRRVDNTHSSLFSLTFGPIYKENQGLYTDTTLLITTPVHAYAGGVGGSIENSFILGFFIPQQGHRLRIGDFLQASLYTGFQRSTTPEQGSKVWTAYRFDIGLVTQYCFTPQSALQIRWIPLLYAKDQISPSISGSSIGFQLLLGMVSFEGSLAARNIRILGFLTAIEDPLVTPHVYKAGFAYRFYPNHTLNLRSEWVNEPRSTYIDRLTGLNVSSSFALQLSYGLAF